MAERARSEDEGGQSSGRKGRSGRLGRRIANALVIAGLSYLILSGLFSVIPQIFWPERAEVPASISCTEGIRDLRAELLARAGERVAAGGATQHDLDAWFRDWDRRHLGLEARCDGTEAESFQLLGRLRERLESGLHRYEAGEADLDRDLTRSLASSAPSTP